jgi:hypothetical protein
MAKLNRERKVLEKRHKKAARKEQRKREAEEGPGGPAIGPANGSEDFAADSGAAASST